MPTWAIVLVAVLGFLLLVVVHDLTQRRHAILRNFPIVGHFRYLLEKVGPELRQYIVTSNNEERPFSRDQRRWVYASSKRENAYFGFGTDEDLELSPSYLILKHAAFPHPEPPAGSAAGDPGYALPCAKVLGGWRGRPGAFRPTSIVNVSAMSYGALSARAVEAINRGCGLASALHNTGEGGIAPAHAHGGELVWQLGTGYFGARDERGRFSEERFVESLGRARVRAIEVKLSQGAKPGLGGVLPAAKVTPEIAAIRGIPVGQTCHSPAAHPEFDDVEGLIDFVERLSDLSGGLPVGIKSAVGELAFWEQLANAMLGSGRGPDFVTIDGGEGGTGAGPLVFTDHVALPFKVGFSRVYRAFAERGLAEQVVFVGSGKLGFPEQAALAFVLGCDLVNVAREAMLAIGCIQAQRCHTGHCPTGVATQSRWLMHGLDPTLKSARLANYLVALRRDLLHVANACGAAHPALLGPEHVEILDGHFGSVPVDRVFDYEPGWGKPTLVEQETIAAIMRGEISA
ncbi:MAG: FMN-binding glutamate synthase family protein [Thermoleophilia bacterium]